jgi:hypothetical protein
MPHYTIPNPRLLRRLLWLDTSLGNINALAFLLFPAFLGEFLGMPWWLVITIGCVNVVYAGSALALALQAQAPAHLVRVLVLANWSWVAVSVGLLFWHFPAATVWGQVFLVMQVVGIAALAWLEGRQLARA